MNIAESTNYLFDKLEQLNGRKVVIKTKNKYTETKKKNKIQTICIDCGDKKTEAYKTGSFQCNSCKELMLSRFRKQQKGSR
ncbi:MAG TPA: hypothetical protein VK094_00195 [Pseudogracilibacillus sp.]|nr:hypothetical protein [Pseudogracilibacillus sp.]